METLMEFALTKEYLEQFQEALDSENSTFILETLDGVNPADISALLDEFKAEECKYVIEILPADVSASVLIEVDDDVRKDFLEHFEIEEIANFLEQLDSDDAADVIMQFSLKKREQVISLISDEEKASHVADLMRYDEDVAGGLMAKELIKANKNWTIRQCIDEIRQQAERVEKIYSVYVVDDLERLIGKVSLKKIILANDNTKVADIYDEDIQTVETYLEEDEVAAIMQKYDLDAVPVVTPRGKLVGRITIDDIVDVITETAEEERQIMSGISTGVDEDDSIWSLSKARLPWLIIGMGGGLLAAQITDLFRGDITLVSGLALFIPLIMATGGNVGIQSSSIVVQSLANPSAFESTVFTRLARVLFVAIVNGAILSLMVLGAVILIFNEALLAYTVCISLFAVVLLASFMGTITPLALDRFGVNPALASGPFITTANDLLGLAVYFSLARAIFSL